MMMAPANPGATIGPPPVLSSSPQQQQQPLLSTNLPVPITTVTTMSSYDSCYNGVTDYRYHLHNHHQQQQQQQHQQQHHHHHHHHHHPYHHYNNDRPRFATSSPSVMNTASSSSLPPTPPDDSNYRGGEGYYFHGGQTGCDASSSVTSSSSLSSSSSSSSSSPPPPPPPPPPPFSSIKASYHRGHPRQQHVYQPPVQTHDCYGVPVHPSVADYPTRPLDQYHRPRFPYYAPPQSSLLLPPPQSSLPPPPLPLPLPLPPPPPSLPLPSKPSSHHNNDYLPPPQPSYEFLDDFKPVKSIVKYNSSRQMRNLAEKQRRNKLNTCINELSQLVPLISNASKKIEKTSVLRLSAAYLRLSRLLTGFREQREVLPVYINKISLADLMLDDRDIYLMVTSAGKIVFVSHSVESILGHSQIDLMGQSLLNITCPEDHDELRNNLKYQEDKPESNNIITTDNTSTSKPSTEGGFKVQRRSFYVRLVKKAVSRSEQRDLELVHVVGTLMMQNSTAKNSVLGGNDIVLNAVVRPYNERRVTEVSMLEATREEYITRHQIDSRIIYVDHRISIVSGFMPHEVSGQLAFTYMHKDDVRWVMIALRQMYFKGQSFGKSCYRLLSKNGEFVYMTTHGYLELNPNEDSIQSFMCVNTLVSPEEGKKEIQKMRERFTPLIRTQSEPGIAAITNNQFMEADSTTSLIHGSTEDPKTINKVVEQMIINIPAPAIDNVKETAQNPLPESQFIKVKLMSESMPPVPSSINVPKIDKQSSMSPQPNIKPLTQDRPSVLRVAPRQPIVVVHNHQQANEKTAEKDREYFERRGDILFISKRHNDLSLPEHSPKKAKIILETQIDSPTCSQYSNQMDGSQSDNQLSTDGYCSLDGFPSFQDTPIDEHNIDLDPLTDVNITSLEHFSKTLDDTDALTQNPLFMTPESYSSYDTGIYNDGNPVDIVIQDPLMHVLQHDGNVESELLEEKQNSLKNKMDQQEGQLKEIQSELNSLSSNADTHYLATNFSNLKAAHEQQRQILRSLKGAHHNIGV